MKTSKRIGIRLSVLACLAVCVFALCACKDPKLTVNYYIDGRKTDTLPDRGLYEIKSIKCNNAKANATWDCDSWSLKTETLTKNTSVDLDFTYTSHPFTMNGIGYDSLQEAFNAAGTTPAEIHITRDATGSGTTAVGSDITLYLHGFALDGMGGETIVNNGTMTIRGIDAAAEGKGKNEAPERGILANTTGSGDNTKTLVNFGTLIAYDLVINNSTESFSIWNSSNNESSMELHNCLIERGEPEIIALVNSGTLLLDGCTISGGGDLTHPTVLQNAGFASIKLVNTRITNSGSGYSLYKESGTVEIDGASECPNAFGLSGDEE